MPIKIKDSTVYECYDSAKCEYGDSKWQALLEAFAGEINDLADGTEMSANDILKVTDAILRGVDVELEEEKRYCMAFETYDIATKEFQTRCAEIIKDINGFPYVSMQGCNEFKATKKEWNEAFKNTPYLNINNFDLRVNDFRKGL
ncbi:hypothetical protein FC56_GL000256 [Lentilactobacillus senioris DSM 24302 = JCM 17472]|uniref:Uncharacterized protein n=1 Tax=Lentilactobacillus senioris DSM 24302 = JCM 17472 TaxID=1423802 RepID=A0A0R2CPS2_9LACO|nr:hypothetical protein [Lentilactobacillus senioris]KRM93543.1 hypothetical protein FC56_GL000256 [Lentilactobacillus senioris DSM 24302 = JCM 17472]